MSVLYDNIRIACKKRGISVSMLERETKITPKTIPNWAHIYPTCDKVLKVANYLNISVDQLLGNQGIHIREEQEEPSSLMNLLRNSDLTNDDLALAIEVAEKFKRHYNK